MLPSLRGENVLGRLMLKVGLTGGIAAGKSVVGDMFVALGAHLVQADRIAHSLMQPGEAVYNEVVRHFGREILNPDGSVNRAKLAEIAFAPATDSPQRVQRTQRKERRKLRASTPRASKNSIASCIPWSSAARMSGWRRWAVRIRMPSPSSKRRSFSKPAAQALRPPGRRNLQRGAASRPLRPPAED